MRKNHLAIWALLSALWAGGVLLAFAPHDALDHAARLAAQAGTEAGPPTAAHLYAEPETARRAARAWQARQASLFFSKRAERDLQRAGLSAVLPPAAALMGLYLLSLRRARLAATAPKSVKRAIQEERTPLGRFETRLGRRTILERRETRRR